jgi:dihydroorotate dehydrogenase (NAD+) catalytic subunit
MAALCQEAGADALTLINTVGPGTAVDGDGNPVLSNVNGGLSGAAILPIGLKAVREAAQKVKIPIIASGGIGNARHVEAYRKAGASLFSVGSALGGMTTVDIAAFFAGLAKDLTTGDCRVACRVAVSPECRTHYIKTLVRTNRPVGPDMFELSLEDGPNCKPGNFFFLRIPGVGEKPFSPAADEQPRYLVRPVGPFTRALEQLKPGDPLHMRGPYGKGFPDPGPEQRIVLIGGGTGSAPIMMAARKWKTQVAKAFFGFSREPDERLRTELTGLVEGCIIAIDSGGKPGEVVHRLSADTEENPDDYRNALVFLCGPSLMMKSSVECLKKITSADSIYTAREDLMRCGVGICGSCGTPHGLRSCVDGPVMAPE